MSQLRKDLEAGKRVLTRSHEEKNELKAENQRKAEEIESLKSQLAQALEENQKLKGGIFGTSRIQYHVYVGDHNIMKNMLPLFARSLDRAA